MTTTTTTTPAPISHEEAQLLRQIATRANNNPSHIWKVANEVDHLLQRLVSYEYAYPTGAKALPPEIQAGVRRIIELSRRAGFGPLPITSADLSRV